MVQPPQLILATGNRDKGLELAELLSGVGVQVKTLAEAPGARDIEESGQSFAENAAIKAVSQAGHLHAWVLGDDSGLVVDALGGGPGIRSARYAGENVTAEQNRQKLLAELADVPLERRAAHFVCHLALADPEGQIRATSQGTCSGRIRFEPAGEQGFGYDSLFEVVEYHRTFGQLGPAAKGVLSHRARAVQRLTAKIQQLIDSGAWTAGASNR